jgi:hypothetical protein
MTCQRNWADNDQLLLAPVLLAHIEHQTQSMKPSKMIF